MTSIQALAMRQFMRLTLKSKKLKTVDDLRQMVAKFKTSAHPDVVIEQTVVNGLDAEWLIPSDANRHAVILYLHGGGYVSGSLDSHRGLASQLAHASNIPLLNLDYRLAPEHPFPTAIRDATEAYQWLLNIGYTPNNILIAGDSAGGGLTLATLLKLRNDHMPLPAGAMCISPWTDLMATGNSVKTHAKLDPWLKPDDSHIPTQAYADGLTLDHPYMSPLYGNLRGLPPILIQVGDREILLSDSTRFAQKAEIAGVRVDLCVWKGMWHVWHMFYDMIPESQQAIEEMATFAKQHVGKPYVMSALETHQAKAVFQVMAV